MPDWQPTIRGEESGETVSSETNGAAQWLCPLCQQGQADRSSLSLHLTGQHSVLPSCVERLLDIAGLKQAGRAHAKATGAQSTSDAASSDLMDTEDVSSGLCQSRKTLNTAETSEDQDMEKDKVMDKDKGESQPETEEEGMHLTAAKQQATSENAEIPDATEKTDVKNVPIENENKPFKCYACLETFPTKTALSVHYNSASHIQRMTTGSGEIDSQKSPVPVLPRPFVSNKPYQCVICRVSYNHAITLESHMKSVLHQTRSRNAGIVANSTVATSNTTSVPKTVASKSGNGNGPLVNAAATCAAPGALIISSTKDGEQIQTSQVAPSLLASPVASAQAASAFLTLLTSSPNNLSHSILPSLFAAGATGAAAPQLVPQPQMVMPLILNGLQAQTQQLPENQQSQLLAQCVPFVGLSAAQQALLAQRLSSLQSQWPSAGVLPNMQPASEEQKHAVKSGKEQDNNESDGKTSVQSSGHQTTDAVNVKEDCPSSKNRVTVEHTEDNGEGQRDSTTDGDSSTNQLDLEGDKAANLTLSPACADKSLRNNISPSVSVRSNSSLSPVHLNLMLSPDSTPKKSQSGTSPSGSHGTPKSSPCANALTNIRTRSVHQDPPVLSEFQTEVLWAFLESRSEADAASPPREDCEALGREVGLSEDEVRRWLVHARLVKQRQKAAGLEHLQALARQIPVSDDDEEHSLVIAEGEDDEACGSMVLDLSSTRVKRKRKEWSKEGRGDSCLTSDSENEVYTSVIVSDEESQNGSSREAVESPAKEVIQREMPSDKGGAGGKVLRSTTVFLSDAEEEYEDEEGGTGQRAKKRKGDFEKDELEVKRDRQDPDVDLELEAQGDPPSSQIQAMDVQAGALHSLPLSLASFSPQFLSPYVLSLSPSMVGDANKVQVFSNPPSITRFPSSLLSQTLSQSQTSHFMSNGGDCEGALDLSMGRNTSKSPSSATALTDKIATQKGQLLYGLGLKPTTKGLVVVQVKPESAAPTSNSNANLLNWNNATKSAICMKAAERMNSSLLKKEHEMEKEQEGENDSQGRKAKGKRYRDMRRSRTVIQAEQLDILYGCYFKDPNPGKHEFEQISEWVQLPKKVVQIWFQNMRARERKGEVRFISDGTLAAVGKPLIKFTWPLAKPIFSNKPPTPNNTGGIAAAPIVRTLKKPEPDPPKEVTKVTLVKKIIPIPIKPKEIVHPAAGSPPSAVPNTKFENTSKVTTGKISHKVSNPVILPPPKDPPPSTTPRPAEKIKQEEDKSEEDVTDEEKDHENQTSHGPGSTNRMVPKLPSTPINNRPPPTPAVTQKQNGLNYWTPKVPIKINTLSREQLSLPAHLPRCIAPPPTPSIAPVSPNTPKVTTPATPTVAKSSPSENNFFSHSSSRRPRTHLSCLQLSILQSCYETCSHPNCLESEVIGTELNLPVKVVQIWFQNTRAKEKRWKLQQENMTTASGEKVDTSSGSYLQYSALKANRPILPKPVHIKVIVPAASAVDGQPAPKEVLTGHCDVCDVSFDSRAAAREHVFSQYHLSTLRTTNFGQPVSLINKNGTNNSGSISAAQGSLSTPVSGTGAEKLGKTPPQPATSSS